MASVSFRRLLSSGEAKLHNKKHKIWTGVSWQQTQWGPLRSHSQPVRIYRFPYVWNSLLHSRRLYCSCVCPGAVIKKTLGSVCVHKYKRRTWRRRQENTLGVWMKRLVFIVLHVWIPHTLLFGPLGFKRALFCYTTFGQLPNYRNSLGMRYNFRSFY